MATAPKTPATVEVTLDRGKVCKGSIRYETRASDAAFSNVYVANATLETLGQPEQLHFTITAA